MSIKQTSAGWTVDIQPGGRGGKRLRKSFNTKAEAKAYEAWVKTQVTQDNAWEPKKKDPRRLSELVNLWYEHHGKELRAGADTHKRLVAMCAAMGNPLAETFKASDFVEYRTQRLAAGISANNMNHEHAYLRAVFNELERLGFWTLGNPLGKLRQLKILQNELSYLTSEQIETLLDSLAASRNPHVALVTKICLSTGARWSEAEELQISQVRNGQIQFAKTKSGKVRSVPICDDLERAINEHYTKHGTGERIFGYAFSAFREGLERTGITLPEGQLTHSLRHSFASHFMINGGNIIALQRILGHASLTMTMRYAHLAPEHLEEARRLNPLTLRTA
ncbi:tyrosine-type recombinase/integrase [Massilia pinisoli]|uniref:Tyrosine-type recombinase/integrase n=1 Tax=Massilia pinisoli TaxID=1772194 RepID=A0ABT1ZQ36_9BURK|nr:tyrosine-type recombinase/integrase [Massilia pinisoli]MCS0582037.1 tyrosine-type recombinase/integrase [Massilia pinisoli]